MKPSKVRNKIKKGHLFVKIKDRGPFKVLEMYTDKCLLDNQKSVHVKELTEFKFVKYA